MFKSELLVNMRLYMCKSEYKCENEIYVYT